MKGYPLDLIGRVYGRLTIIAREDSVKGRARWRCRCECGTEKIVYGNNLYGGTLSCGCLAKETTAARMRDEKTTHGMTGTRTHRCWGKMLDRCRNPRNSRFEHYGGRGITVCERWLMFENFLADMGKAPEGLSIDRIDNNLGYEPGNCRWADYFTQNNNLSRNHRIEFDGMTMTVSQWARHFGVDREKLRWHLRKGEPISTFCP